MQVNEALQALVDYAVRTGLVEEEERPWAVNTLLEGLKLDSWTPPGGARSAQTSGRGAGCTAERRPRPGRAGGGLGGLPGPL